MTLFRFYLATLLLAILSQQVVSQPCNSCGGSNVQSDTSETKNINAGVDMISCQDLIEIAAQRRANDDVCWIVQGYAHQYCNCLAPNGLTAKPPTYKTDTAYCNLCDGEGGSDLWTIDPLKAKTLVDSGVHGFPASCADLYKYGTKRNAFRKSQCSTLQNSVRSTCGCALRDVNGKEIGNVDNNNGYSFCLPTPNSRCDNTPCCAGLTCIGIGKWKYCARLRNRNLRGHNVTELEQAPAYFDEQEAGFLHEEQVGAEDEVDVGEK